MAFTTEVLPSGRRRLASNPRLVRNTAQAFLGRSKGLVIEHVSLAQAKRKDIRKGFNKKAAAWRALRRIVAQAVGKLAAWRKGRTNLHTSQCAVHTVASILLPNVGQWEQEWEFPSQAALANTPGETVISENWTDLVRRVMLFVNRQTQLAVNFSTPESARGWRQWAKEACLGSARAGHAFTKIGTDDGEQGALAGPGLLVKQLGTWLPL